MLYKTILLSVLFTFLFHPLACAHQYDSAKRPIFTILFRTLPPWVISGGGELHVLKRHSVLMTYGINNFWFGQSDGIDYEKFKSFDYRFYFAFRRKNQFKDFFISPSFKVANRFYDSGEGNNTDWQYYKGDDQVFSLLIGKRKYFRPRVVSLEFYCGLSFVRREIVERIYYPDEDLWDYRTHTTTFENLRLGFTIGYTFYVRKKQ